MTARPLVLVCLILSIAVSSRPASASAQRGHGGRQVAVSTDNDQKATARRAPATTTGRDTAVYDEQQKEGSKRARPSGKSSEGVAVERGTAGKRDDRADRDGALIYRSADERSRYIIQRYYDRRGLPPGLAKKDSLPPGLAKQLRERGHLPPGLEKHMTPLPGDLERQLPPLPRRQVRRLVGNDLVILDSRTNRVLSVIENIF